MDDSVEVHWAPGAEAYVTPVADDCVGIAILCASRGGFDRHFECVRRAAGPGRAATPTVRTGPRDRCARRFVSRAAGRVLLVGDAAGYIDALTGEGMGLAFGAAELLVDCVVRDWPEDYDLQWRRADPALSHADRGTTARGRTCTATRSHCPCRAKAAQCLRQAG